MNETSLEIVEASRADAAVLANIVRAAFQDVADFLKVTPETCAVFPAFLQTDRIEADMDKGAQFYFARVAGCRVGCVGMTQPENGECILIRLAVMPAYRHHGLGRTLVEFILSRARRLGLQRVTLGMVAKHVQLRTWYESIGFVMTEKKRYGHIPFDVGYMKYECNKQEIGHE